MIFDHLKTHLLIDLSTYQPGGSVLGRDDGIGVVG